MSIDAKWVIGILLALQTLFVGSTFDTSATTLAYAAIVLMLVYVRLGRQETVDDSAVQERTHWLTWIVRAAGFAVVALITTALRFESYVGEGVNPMVAAIDVLAHCCLFAGWMVWFLYPSRGHVSLLPLGLIVVLLSVAAGGASHSLAGQTTVGLSACIGFLFASQAILSCDRATGRVPSDDADDAVGGERIRMATLLSLLTLSAILMATSALARTTSSALPGIQNMLHEKLKASLDSAATEMSIGGTRYVSGGRLGSIRKVILGDPNDVALRLYSESAPGYLRGHAFDLYKDRQWHSAPGIVLGNHSAVKATENRYVNRTGTGTTPLAKKLRTKLSRFPIHEDQQQATISIEVHNDPIKGPTVFTPLGTRWLEASSGQLTITHNDIVQSGVAVTRPYIAGVASNPPQQSLTTERGKIFLWVPEEISPLAEKLTAEICRNETTASGKAGAISRYFQETFQYSLSGLPIPKRAEPIVFFLETEHPAHCEYFASATVMLLRSSGVPARYVTGYVATEASDDAEYWIARNRDAHAWAEAYDNESQRWFPVESTPGRTYQTLDFKDANQNGSTLFGGKGDRDDFGDRSRLGQIWGWLMSMRATDPLIVIFRIAQLPLFCLLAFLLWRRSGRSSSGHSQPIDVQSRRMLRQVDRRMRSYALVRVPHETLHQFAARIENRLMAENASDKSQVLIAAATWYRQYADARYRGRLPNPFQRVSSHRVTVSKR